MIIFSFQFHLHFCQSFICFQFFSSLFCIFTLSLLSWIVFAFFFPLFIVFILIPYKSLSFSFSHFILISTFSLSVHSAATMTHYQAKKKNDSFFFPVRIRIKLTQSERAKNLLNFYLKQPIAFLKTKISASQTLNLFLS